METIGITQSVKSDVNRRIVLKRLLATLHIDVEYKYEWTDKEMTVNISWPKLENMNSDELRNRKFKVSEPIQIVEDFNDNDLNEIKKKKIKRIVTINKENI